MTTRKIDAKEAIKKLPGRIKVRVTQSPMGYVRLCPVSQRIEKLISLTNAYDGTGYTCLESQDAIESFCKDYPRATYGRGKNKQVNDGVVFMIDSWTFRHMCGGQSD